MPRFLIFSMLLLVTALAGCKGVVPSPSQPHGPALQKIVGFDEQRFFVDSSGQRFFPWGFNYLGTQEMQLIDDNLHSEHVWQVIAQDFAEMKSYSANTVRIHLQYHRFMLEPQTPDPRAFAALKRLVDIAEKEQLYLVLTGLGAYRKADSPHWYDELDMHQRWQTQALFWKTLARSVGHSSAVFAYDLMNEPVVSVCNESELTCSWQVGEALGTYHFVQNISVDPALPYRETMQDWILGLRRAIHEEDKNTFITVGHLGLVPLNQFENEVDFVSAHIYPRRYKLRNSVGYVNMAKLDRPLVISEIYNMYCDVNQLGLFLDAIDGRYQGLLGHYNGKTIEELQASGELVDKIRLSFLRFFIARNPNTVAATSTD